ncbi:MAG: endopeptidase La [bacterium]
MSKIDGFNQEELERIDIPDTLPILPVRDTVLFPFISIPLIINSKKSIKLLDEIMSGDKTLGLVAIHDSIDDPKPSDLYLFGTAAKVIRLLKFPEGTIRIILSGIRRIKIDKIIQEEPYFISKITPVKDIINNTIELEATAKNAANQFQKIISLQPYLPDELKIVAMNIDSPGLLADFVASNLNLNVSEKQEILESFDVKTRLEKVTIFLNKELKLLELGSKIQENVQNKIDKTQREFYLREQMKAIQNELGDEDERSIEVKDLKEKIGKSTMPKEVEKEALKELNRLQKMPPGVAEYTVSRNYLDWLISLPWSVETKDSLDISDAKIILDNDHYNLEKVKERILEYLGVRKLKQDMKGPILCFVGPPGVGKTSLGKSIARALGRKFIRMSLGGVRDEAEIRGHRRTYVGALPGKIIQGIQKAGSKNPVFMLDEVDKLGTDFRGDPSSALLEVLDPEQNYSFTDHYINLPFDLSKVIFITTANILDPVPPALRDRMEVIELPGYSLDEKMFITEKFLIPRQLKEHGLTKENLEFSKDALPEIIQNYTQEAGLRNLEREIATICRKVAKEIASSNCKNKFLIQKKNLSNYLGQVKFFSETAQRLTEPGISIGLAWTPTGGDIIFVESTMMKGSKNLNLTGQLGSVMKESAQAALSYIRSHAQKYKISEDFFEKHDLHLHVPAGAIPKDGPSAGVAITSSLVSLLTGHRVKNNLAMTGEITLRGTVLPVGGIKEKVLAALRAGIKTIILPSKNEKDVMEIPKHIQNKLKFIYVNKIDEVLKVALEK